VPLTSLLRCFLSTVSSFRSISPLATSSSANVFGMYCGEEIPGSQSDAEQSLPCTIATCHSVVSKVGKVGWTHLQDVLTSITSVIPTGTFEHRYFSFQRIPVRYELEQLRRTTSSRWSTKITFRLRWLTRLAEICSARQRGWWPDARAIRLRAACAS
jgi:hypothetical protein